MFFAQFHQVSLLSRRHSFENSVLTTDKISTDSAGPHFCDSRCLFVLSHLRATFNKFRTTSLGPNQAFVTSEAEGLALLSELHVSKINVVCRASQFLRRTQVGLSSKPYVGWKASASQLPCSVSGAILALHPDCVVLHVTCAASLMHAACRRPPSACVAAIVLGLTYLFGAPVFAQNIDGGRSELPGMKQDMFDMAQKQKKVGGQRRIGGMLMGAG